MAENVSWPIEQWATWEVQMGDNNTDSDIKVIADDWIASNKTQYDAWVDAARTAAP